MPDVNVTYEQMESAAQRLSAGQEEITSQLTQLKAMVDDLVESGFVTDVASKTFSQAYTEFNTGVSQTIEGLEVMSSYLKQTAEKFREADQTSTIQVSGS
jgi:WXG100 family type VII secretion target